MRLRPFAASLVAVLAAVNLAAGAGLASGGVTAPPLASITKAEAEASTPKRLPVFVLAPMADVAIARGVFFSTQFSVAALLAATPAIRLGLSGAISDNVTNSLEGCSVVEHCVRSWTALGANFEYHVRPGRSADFWAGAQAGVAWQKGTRQDTMIEEHRTLPFLQPSIGVDFGGAFGAGYLGAGLVLGIPVTLTNDPGNIGLMVGIRGLLGKQ